MSRVPVTCLAHIFPFHVFLLFLVASRDKLSTSSWCPAALRTALPLAHLTTYMLALSTRCLYVLVCIRAHAQRDGQLPPSLAIYADDGDSKTPYHAMRRCEPRQGLHGDFRSALSLSGFLAPQREGSLGKGGSRLF